MAPPLIRCAAALLVLLAAAPCYAAPATEHRGVVHRIAELIEQWHFDPAAARVLAEALGAEATSGAYDSARDPTELAAALTRRLQREDPHFGVRHDPDSGAGESLAARTRRTNGGFRSVSVLAGNVGYIQLTSFAYFAEALPGPRRAADAALAFVAQSEALIIDLRGNPGGAPLMTGYLLSAFFPAGADVYSHRRGRSGTADGRPKFEVGEAQRTTAPVFVLVDAATASAAEEFAYTLQAARRAIIVGERTAGAANGSGRFFAPPYSVRIPTDSPVNPVTGSNWQGRGVEPDVRATSPDALRIAHRLALEGVIARRGSDAPLDAGAALEALEAPAGRSPPASPP